MSRIAPLALVTLLLPVASPVARAQTGEWRVYGADTGLSHGLLVA